MTDQIITIVVITGLAVSVGLIIFFAIKFQQTLAEKEVDEIELKDASLQKQVDDMSLTDLVDSNNKSKGK